MLQAALLLSLVPGPAALAVHKATNAGTAFFENRGQWPTEAHYGALVGGTFVAVCADGLVMAPAEGGGAVVELRFDGASDEARAEGRGLRPGVYHSYMGNDPSGWVTNVRSYDGVWMRDVYDGVDVEVAVREGRLKYDVHVAPGADLSQVVVQCSGHEALWFGEEGLVLESELGELVQPAAESWQATLDGERRPVEVGYRRIADDRFGFAAGGRDPELSLVIDPELLWSTYWGGITGMAVGQDEARDVVLDANGDVTYVGTVEGDSVIQTRGTFQSAVLGTSDVYVSKFRQSDGELRYSARIGGSSVDQGQGVAADGTGRVTVVADAMSDDFPSTPGAFDEIKDADLEAVSVFRLSPLGDVLEYATFLEDERNTEASAVALSVSGSAIVLGVSSEEGLPVTPGVLDEDRGIGLEPFLARLGPTGSDLEWLTYLGANGSDVLSDIAVGAQDTIYTVGESAGNYPTTPGAYQETPAPNIFGVLDFAVSHVAADGSSLIWSTFVGGGGSERGRGIALMPDGTVVCAGWTPSFDFPTTPGVIQQVKGGQTDAVVFALNSTGSDLVWSTYLGVASNEGAEDVAVDASGVVTITGGGAANFPITPGAYDELGENAEIWVTRLSPGARKMLYSTFVGGGEEDEAQSIVVSPKGRVSIGARSVGDYPTTSGAAFPSFIGGLWDSVFTTFDLYLQGVVPRGDSRPSCLGPVVANALAMPVAGASFGLYCSQAPPSTQGFLIVRPANAFGSAIPHALGWLRPVVSDASGYLETPLGNLVSGLTFHCQYVFPNAGACSGAGPVATSNGLVVRVQ